MSVENRIRIEKEIVGRLVKDILAAGHRVSVSLDRGYDLDEMLLGSRDEAAIMKATFEGDDCHLFIHDGAYRLIDGGKLVSDGWVYLVFGNDGWDVVSDYSATDDVEALMRGADSIAERYR